MEQTSKDISDVISEAAVIASVLLNPSLIYFSENLKPSYFTNDENSLIYYAVSQLTSEGITECDSYNVMNAMMQSPKMKSKAEKLITNQLLDNMFENAPYIARTSPEDYKQAANSVVRASFRRETLRKLDECKSFCFNAEYDNDIEKKIYGVLDEVMSSYSINSELPPLKDEVDKLWKEIEDRQTNGGDGAGIPFKWATLNNYCTVEAGELFCVAARAKEGKSMFLLNETVDLLKRSKKVLYIDSELSSRAFLGRLVSNLTGIDYHSIKDGSYRGSEDAEDLIKRCIGWLKQQEFTHVYCPILDNDTLFTTIRKVYNMMGGLDVVVVDYIKSPEGTEAFEISNKLGSMVNLLKNVIAGSMNVAVLTAAQLNRSNQLADSDKIVRYCSTVATIEPKTDEEILRDGPDCGNKKLRIIYNRNGMQSASAEDYIDLLFDGNHILYREPKRQHTPEQLY